MSFQEREGVLVLVFNILNDSEALKKIERSSSTQENTGELDEEDDDDDEEDL